MTEKRYAAHKLRDGRWSSSGQIYLATTATNGRIPVFADFSAARTLIQIIRQDELLGSHQTLCFVVMPDHLHWMLQLQNEDLTRLVGRVKSISAKRLGRPIWQKGFHDHALRREEDVRNVARYVVANPLRAGLVERAGDYPHWDAVWICGRLGDVFWHRLGIAGWLPFAAGRSSYRAASFAGLVWEPRLGAKLLGMGSVLRDGRHSPRGAAPTRAV